MFFIVLFQTKHGREQLDKVLKKSIVNFYFWGITLIRDEKFPETRRPLTVWKLGFFRADDKQIKAHK